MFMFSDKFKCKDIIKFNSCNLYLETVLGFNIYLWEIIGKLID